MTEDNTMKAAGQIWGVVIGALVLVGIITIIFGFNEKEEKKELSGCKRDLERLETVCQSIWDLHRELVIECNPDLDEGDIDYLRSLNIK